MRAPWAFSSNGVLTVTFELKSRAHLQKHRKRGPYTESLTANARALYDMLSTEGGTDEEEEEADRHAGLTFVLPTDETSRVHSVREKLRKTMRKWCCCNGVHVTAAVLLVSLIIPFLGTFLVITTARALEVHIWLADHSWLLWFLWCAAFTCIAVAPSELLPEMVGSGIPELRAILSGARLDSYLRPLLLPVKLLSSVALVSSGIWVGFEGPMIHISCLIASSLVRLPMFHAIKKSPELFNSLIAMSAGAGLSGALGAPIGGVLYTIEEIASCHRIDQLWFAFLAGVPGGIIFRIFLSYWESTLPHSGKSFSLTAGVLEPDVLVPFSFGILDFCWAALLGVIGGLFGVLFIKCNSWCVSLKLYLARRSVLFSHEVIFIVFIVVVSSLVFFPGWTGKFMGFPPYVVLLELTTPDTTKLIASGWTFIDIRIVLAFFFVVKLFMLSISITMPASTGFYVALLACGSALGRLFGILWQSVSPQTDVSPDIFALLGAAAIAASVTHSVSTVVIVLELCGRMDLLVPLLTSTLLSVWVSRVLTQCTPIYERMALNRKLLFIPDLDVNLSNACVRDVPCTRLYNQYVVTRTIELKALRLLCETESSISEFPVVTSSADMVFLGFVPKFELQRYLSKIQRICNTLPLLQEHSSRNQMMRVLQHHKAPGLYFTSALIELSPE